MDEVLNQLCLYQCTDVSSAGSLPPDVTMDEVLNQFSLYQCTDVSQHKADRLDMTWSNIGRVPDLFELSVVMRGILVVSLSSAHCERIFSCVKKNKTPQRCTFHVK